MTTKSEYEHIGKFIYSAYRYDADVSDVHNWMADDLGAARPAADDELALRKLYTAFFAKYANNDEFQANYERFVDKIKGREA